VVAESPDFEDDRLPAGAGSLPHERPSLFAGPAEMVTATRVARRYYCDKRAKLQIASVLGITPFDVARLLELARTSGLVHIRVDEVDDLGLSEPLCERSGPRQAEAWNPTRDNDTKDSGD
jgi:DNA-binding transcriptional regulator LsrR (DeoR family)